MEDELINKPGNRSCVVCEGRNPTWGCYPYGILCCTKCSGQFRELSTSVCTVKSLLLDEVSEEFLAPFRRGSNSLFLEWYHKQEEEELTPSFFRTSAAKGFLDFLQRCKDTNRASNLSVSSAVHPMGPSRKQKSKLQAAAVDEESSEEEEEEKEEEKHVEISKKTLKRVPGAISIDKGSEKRMGLFKNTQNEEKRSPTFSSNSSVMGTGGEKYSSPTQSNGVVRGSNYVGSAEVPQETITDRIRKGIEKGKKNIMERLKKTQK
ncbi:hypothetical protein NEFER03_2091 [Nematocida sp. LUAm3]|nr:hypothetical protein NEFER03_2091 [Nematocida sp. LUAm3]KAI5175657.1 hypothetical protein NEFER02_1544 [Nematocida sp. LUAm2]KAI5178563.1 hypothetical protein NEFER01_1699 [Nematocida sp. LUAm1]